MNWIARSDCSIAPSTPSIHQSTTQSPDHQITRSPDLLIRLVIASAVVLSIAAAAVAQRRLDDFGGFSWGRTPAIHNIPYDGRFTFVRIQYETAPGGYWAGGRPSWVHGYPIAEENLMRIMNDISYPGPHTDEVNVLTL